jgi:hypothetical protein
MIQPTNTPKAMIHTIQLISESGSFGQPDGTNVYFGSYELIKGFFQDWVDLHESVGTDTGYARALVWKGRLQDVTDQYPDYELRLGPRGGIVRDAV